MTTPRWLWYLMNASDTRTREGARRNQLIRQYAASWPRGGCQPSQCSRPRLTGAMAELSFESPAETRGIRKAGVLGDCRIDRCSRVAQERLRFEQPLALNEAGDATCVFEQPIEIGAGHSDEPAQVLRPQGRGPEVPADRLPHPLLAAEIDLPPGTRSARPTAQPRERPSRQQRSKVAENRPPSRPPGGVAGPSCSRRADVRGASSADPQAASSRCAISRNASRRMRNWSRSICVRSCENSCPSDHRYATRRDFELRIRRLARCAPRANS